MDISIYNLSIIDLINKNSKIYHEIQKQKNFSNEYYLKKQKSTYKEIMKDLTDKKSRTTNK